MRPKAFFGRSSPCSQRQPPSLDGGPGTQQVRESLRIEESFTRTACRARHAHLPKMPHDSLGHLTRGEYRLQHNPATSELTWQSFMGSRTYRLRRFSSRRSVNAAKIPRPRPQTVNGSIASIVWPRPGANALVDIILRDAGNTTACPPCMQVKHPDAAST